jgi:hypothetical protein
MHVASTVEHCHAPCSTAGRTVTHQPGEPYGCVWCMDAIKREVQYVTAVLTQTYTHTYLSSPYPHNINRGHVPTYMLNYIDINGYLYMHYTGYSSSNRPYYPTPTRSILGDLFHTTKQQNAGQNSVRLVWTVCMYGCTGVQSDPPSLPDWHAASPQPVPVLFPLATKRTCPSEELVGQEIEVWS